MNISECITCPVMGAIAGLAAEFKEGFDPGFGQFIVWTLWSLDEYVQTHILVVVRLNVCISNYVTSDAAYQEKWHDWSSWAKRYSRQSHEVTSIIADWKKEQRLITQISFDDFWNLFIRSRQFKNVARYRDRIEVDPLL